MSGEASGFVWRSSPYRGATFVVHLAIADVVNDLHGNEFWMSTAALAKKTRLNRTTVHVSLAQIENDGLITRVSDDSKTGRSVRYRFEGLVSDKTQGLVSDKRGLVSDKTPSIELTKENVTLSEIDAAFDEFWSCYPRKIGGKAAAKTRFRQAVKAGTTAEEIIEGARRYAADPNLPTGDEVRFIPYPAKWLQRGQWTDGPLPARGGRRAGGVTTEGILAAMGGGS